MIKKVKGGFQVLSSLGRNMGGPYKTLAEAKNRLKQIEFFKHRKAGKLLHRHAT
jgi:7,8-dihydro-6-hydroxymethylpterin-pyrophosphokinase